MADSERLRSRADTVLDSMRRAAGWTPEKQAEIARKAAALPDDWAQREDARILAEQREQRSRIMLSRIEPKYRDAEPRHQISVQWLADYRAGKRHNLVIIGDIGVGKTWEANALARLLLAEDFVPVTIVSTADMIEVMKPNADGVSDEGQFKVAPVLVLDDLGAERLTEFAGSKLCELLDYRMRKLLPTIVTSNLLPKLISERYDGRTFRRIFEGAAMLVITGNAYSPKMPFDPVTFA
jgi:DNA replication protein DnaC